MNRGTTTLSFWERKRCEYCNGHIREKNTDLSRKVKGKYVFIENVPTGVCMECGTRYYTANVKRPEINRRNSSWPPEGKARGSDTCVLTLTSWNGKAGRRTALQGR